MDSQMDLNGLLDWVFLVIANDRDFLEVYLSESVGAL